MQQPKSASTDGISQVAGRILIAWRNGHCASLELGLEQARRLTSSADYSSTFEMERLEALTGAVESIGYRGTRDSVGAVRLLEHLAQPELAQTF